MSRWLNRIFGLRPGDLRAAFPFFALQAGIAAYWAVAASAGDALLLSLLREHSLSVQTVVPWTYLAVAVASGAVMTAFDALQSRLPRRALMAGTPLALGLSVAAFRPLVAVDAAWVRFALVVWLEMAALVSMTLAFSLAADRFGSRDAKRLYGLIGGGFCAGLAGGGAAVPWLARRAGAENLLLCAAALLFANAAVSLRVARAAAAPPGETPDPEPPVRALAADPYLRLLAAAVFMGAALFVLVDFQLKRLASGLPRDEIAAYFGRLYGWAGAGEALVQFVLLRPLIRRAGVLNLQLVYPSLMAAGSAVVLRIPGLASVAAANVARMISAESVERPTRELLFLPLARRLRARAQALVNGPVSACGQASAALVVLALGAATTDPRALPAASLIAAALAAVPLILLRRHYRRLLTEAIRSEPLETVDLARLAHEPGARETLVELASSGDESKARFARAALELADGASPKPVDEPAELESLADPSLSSARRCALAAELGRRGGDAAASALWAVVPAADAALAAAAARSALEIQRREGWEGPSHAELERRRAAGAAALLQLARAARAAGDDAFRTSVIGDFARLRADVLLSLHGLNGGPPELDRVRLDLWSAQPSSRAAALELAEELLPSRAAAALSAWADPSAGRAPARPRPESPSAFEALEPALARLLHGGTDAARTAQLSELALLSDLEAPYVLQLLESSKELSLAPGEVLFREGQRGDALILVEEGDVSIRIGARVIASLGRGECVGELSVLDGRPRSADAVAATACRLLSIEREAFRSVFAGRPAAGLSMLRVLERRLRARPASAAAAETTGVSRPAPERAAAGARGRLLVAAALRRVPLLDGLPDAALTAVAGLARPLPVFAGETLFEQGERGEALYLVASGRVQVLAGASLLADLGPGDVVGELALISGLGRTAAVRVAADGLLFSVAGEDFQRLLRDEPAVLWSLLQTLAGRLRASLNDPACAPRH